jgi:hypothetical protein
MKGRYFFGRWRHVSVGNQHYFEAASAVATFSSPATNERAAGSGVVYRRGEPNLETVFMLG